MNDPYIVFKMNPGRDLTRIFGGEQPVPTFGRTALIFCLGEPAVEVLEVMPPGLTIADEFES